MTVSFELVAPILVLPPTTQEGEVGRRVRPAAAGAAKLVSRPGHARLTVLAGLTAPCPDHLDRPDRHRRCRRSVRSRSASLARACLSPRLGVRRRTGTHPSLFGVTRPASRSCPRHRSSRGRRWQHRPRPIHPRAGPRRDSCAGHVVVTLAGISRSPDNDSPAGGEIPLAVMTNGWLGAAATSAAVPCRGARRQHIPRRCPTRAEPRKRFVRPHEPPFKHCAPDRRGAHVPPANLPRSPLPNAMVAQICGFFYQPAPRDSATRRIA